MPQISGYRLIRLIRIIGRGGMGIVYEAEQLALKRRVALKLLPAFFSSASPDAVTRFRREATAAARLAHTNIIPIYDFGQSRDGHYYAMELIEGRPLDAVIKTLAGRNVTQLPATDLAELLHSRLTYNEPTDDHEPSAGAELAAVERERSVSRPRSGVESRSGTTGRGRVYFLQIARWMADVADALDFAHKDGVIHRDIKPSNLILSRDGRLMIGDFGLARGPDDQSVTITGAVLDTLRYMSPEQAMARRMHLDHRTDIYSLGATLYEFLAFQPAVPGNDQKEIFARIITAESTLPRKVNPSVPGELQTICMKMMEKAPEARYATAGELTDDLRRYINDLPIAANPPGFVTRTLKFVRRNKAATIGVTSLVAIALATVITINAVAARRPATFKHHFNKGGVLLDSGAWESAEQELRAANEIIPSEPDPYFERVRLRLNRINSGDGDAESLLEEANSLCDHALELSPNDAYGLNTCAIVCKKGGHFQRGLELAERAIDLDPTYSAYNNAALFHALLGDLDAAEDRLWLATRATERGPKDKGKYTFQPWRNLAALLLQKQDERVPDVIGEASARNHQDPYVCLMQARINLELDAEIDYTRALELAIAADFNAEGQDPRANRVLASARLRNAQWEGAIQSAENAILLGDQVVPNHAIQSIAERLRGNESEARTLSEKVRQAVWPKGLRQEGYLVDADGGVLWFESAEAWSSLVKEATTWD